MSVKKFIKHHFRHFNAATVVAAAEAYQKQLDSGHPMLVTLAGAMSSAELGLSLAEMIRQDKVHAISCTGANLEEDLFNLVAHDHYERIPGYRYLSAADEVAIRDRGLARVTDTCIPEQEAMRKLERHILKLWTDADAKDERYFPHEFAYKLILSGMLKEEYQIDPKDSWLVAAAEKNLPMFVPGWEDSTMGNIFVSHIHKGSVAKISTVKSGLEYMDSLIKWYDTTSARKAPGFFQIGGGIAGDFPICVVPLMRLDLERDTPYWSYFCQISDSTTSYGSYSGALPNEKITWDKIDEHTPQFVIESDATIVAPLIFAYLLDW